MDIFFFLAGIVLFFRKNIAISKKRKISGRPVKILACLYVLPFISSSVLAFFSGMVHVDPYTWVPQVGAVLVIVALVATLYYIFTTKGSASEAVPASSTTG